MKKTSALLLVVLMVACMMLTACNKKQEEASEQGQSDQSQESADLLTGIYTAQITIKNHGVITVEMDADKAPITVTNFVNLVKDGFYDGLTFHRIIEGFMMQGGDPLGNGTGGAEKQIKGEFQQNGVKNDQSHTRGAISMARAKDMNSASSQFFIVHADSTFLDGQYACFGYVTDGMDVVDEICENTPVVDGNGTVKAEDQPVIESIVIQ